MIKAVDLSYNYIRRDENDQIIEEVHALKDINLDIEKGQFVAIVGHNGSGKSTLAKLINGLYKPSAGHLYVDGMDTSDESKIWDIRRTAGMVFQNPDNQIIASVVEEDVAFGPENMGVPSEEIVKRVGEALKAVGMSEYATASPTKLSGGQKQRVAIAGALAMKPQCIIFDESTAMLDPIGRAEVMDVIKRLRSEGMTIVLITHYMEEAAQADRVIVLSGGKIKLDDTPAKVFASGDELMSYGLELPEVAAIARDLRRGGMSLSEGILTADELADAIAGANLAK